MGGLKEIRAITSLVLEVVGSVEKVIAIFDSIQNAPDEFNQSRGSLLRLSGHFRVLEKLEDAGFGTISTSDLHDVSDTLELCRKLFDE